MITLVFFLLYVFDILVIILSIMYNSNTLKEMRFMKFVVKLLKKLFGLILKGIYLLGVGLVYLSSYILGPLLYFVIGCFLYSLFTATWIHIFLLGGLLVIGVILFFAYSNMLFLIDKFANYLLSNDSPNIKKCVI